MIAEDSIFKGGQEEKEDNDVHVAGKLRENCMGKNESRKGRIQ